jgi:methyl-accepting chemotaxis protein
MTIKAKILVLVAAFAVMASAITGLSLATMSAYNRTIDAYRHDSELAFHAERLNRDMTELAVEMRGIYMARDENHALLAADQVDDSASRLQGQLDLISRMLKPGELPQFIAVRKKVAGLAGGGHFIAAYVRQHGRDAANTIGNTDAHREFREHLQSEVDFLVADLSSRLVQSQAALTRFEATRQLQFLLIAGSGILIMLCASLWVAVVSISRPLTAVRNAIVSVSQGAYDTPIPPHSDDDAIGRVWTALDILKDRAAEAERLTREKLAQEQQLRELMLD